MARFVTTVHFHHCHWAMMPRIGTYAICDYQELPSFIVCLIKC
uniref:Uncharacterized protein n=1 Tax=Arundo donax TaxID=35708 RepID=A0A0A9QDS2_ARUDO